MEEIKISIISEEKFNKLKVKISDGDKKAEEELFNIFSDLLKSVIYEYVKYDNAFDLSYYKESLIGESFLRTLKNKEEIKNMDLKLFVWRLKRDCNQIGMKHIRYMNTKKRTWYRENVCSLDKYTDDIRNNPKDKDILKLLALNFTTKSVEKLYMDNETGDELAKLINEYPKQEVRYVIYYKLQGYKNEEISNKLNISCNNLNYIMTKFRKYIKNNYLREVT